MNKERQSDVLRMALGILFLALYLVAVKLNTYPIVIYAFLLCSYLILGFEVITDSVKNLFHGNFFDENFLMSIATVGALVIGEYTEAVLVMLFYSIGEFAQDSAVDKSLGNIEKLMEIRPESARILISKNEFQIIKPENVQPGSILKVLPGEQIPLDGILLSEKALLNTIALTGESKPVKMKKGTNIASGCIVLDSPVLIQVTSSYENSTLTRIIESVQSAQESKAPTVNFIDKFARIYTPSVCGFALLLFLIPSLITGAWSLWLHRALTFLVISCPCALVLSIPLTFFAGIGSCAKRGILIKGGTILETLSKADAFAFDKTGTLTKGTFEVLKTQAEKPYSEEELLSICAGAEANSNHPIAKSVTTYCKKKNINRKEATDSIEIEGKGLCSTIENNVFYVGNASLMNSVGINVIQEKTTDTVIYVSNETELIGRIYIGDSVKESAAETIELLRKAGVKTLGVISGDSEYNVKETAELLNLDYSFYGQLPEQKLERIREIKEDYTFCYVGDGINDAPCLAAADVGMSMGALGSAIAIESSDMVIMQDELTKIPQAIKIARKTLKLARQNIIFALSVKTLCMIMGAFGITGMILAVFADTGVALLCVLNGMRALSNK